jgi:uncharacterized protein YlxP (DUF503 family)
VLTLRLGIPENHSLKGKRAALRPLISALGREFGVSVAEVADQDLWQTAVVGVGVVSGDGGHAQSVLSAVVNRVASWEGDVVLGDSATELINVGVPGRGARLGDAVR